MSFTRPNEMLLLLSPFLAGIGGGFVGVMVSIVWRGDPPVTIAVGIGVIVSWLAVAMIAFKTSRKSRVKPKRTSDWTDPIPDIGAIGRRR